MTFAFATAGASILAPAGAPAIRLREEILLLVSCGADMNRLRDISGDVIRRLDHVLRFDLASRYNLNQWDYRLDPSRDEPAGHMADRSLKQVDESEGVVAILGRTVPRVTHLEIRRVFELRQLGQHRQLWIFVRASRQEPRSSGSAGGADLPLRELIDEIQRDFKRDLIYRRVQSELDFQAGLMTSLFPFLVQRIGTGYGPVGVVA